MNCSCGHPIQEHSGKGCKHRNIFSGVTLSVCHCKTKKSDFVDGLETRLEQAEALLKEADICLAYHMNPDELLPKIKAWLGV